jgi:DNA-binding transcriptional regulator YiaG
MSRKTPELREKAMINLGKALQAVQDQRADRVRRLREMGTVGAPEAARRLGVSERTVYRYRSPISRL